MKILSIDTSCDETSAAVLDDQKILSNIISSQIEIHKEWGGVVPSLAKKAHMENIDYVLNKALTCVDNSVNDLSNIDYIAVTYGPGLSVALEVGIKKAKELALKFNKKLIAVNHLEGHIYSAFENKEFNFPYLVLTVSGGHTSLVKFTNHIEYEVLGETQDDAAGEALDKAAKMLGLGYPGGVIIEKLASLGDAKFHKFPRPMQGSKDLNFSFSGLKTSLFYFLKTLSEKEIKENLNNICASFQEAVFDTLIKKFEKAIIETKITNLLLVGGVCANKTLREKAKNLSIKHNGEILFPENNKLYGDNAAMIGFVAYYKASQKKFVKDISSLDRVPRLEL